MQYTWPMPELKQVPALKQKQWECKKKKKKKKTGTTHEQQAWSSTDNYVIIVETIRWLPKSFLLSFTVDEYVIVKLYYIFHPPLQWSVTMCWIFYKEAL